MDYTKNYHLPQWVKSDRIMMDDFNEMNASIEAGLTATDSKADAAVSTANAASQTASAAAAAKPYVTGFYVGGGPSTSRSVNLGFRPSFVIISGMKGSNSNLDNSPCTNYFAMTAGRAMSGRVTITDTGFTVNASLAMPELCESGRSYDYIAFK